ncbi:MAG: TRAP transporter small permease [Deltaproteobacteria bacterium]|nr:TRAP transporter small permease [Deltaproteobacteria bacterium]
MKSWIERMSGSLEWFVGGLFLALFLLNILRIALRYFFGIAWLWEPDFSRLLFIWIVFIGATVLYARKGHLVVDYFLNQTKPKNRERMHFIIDLVTAIFLGTLVLKGIEVAKVRMRIPFDTWDFPTGYAYMAVPICGAIMIIVTLVRMGDFLWDRRKNEH